MRLVLAVLLLVATQARAEEPTRYLELVNRAHDRVTTLAVAPVGGAQFRDVPLASSLRGGGGSATVQIAQTDCRYDLRMEFANGRTVTYRDVDVCRHARLRIAKLPRTPGEEPALAAR